MSRIDSPVRVQKAAGFTQIAPQNDLHLNSAIIDKRTGVDVKNAPGNNQPDQPRNSVQIFDEVSFPIIYNDIPAKKKGNQNSVDYLDEYNLMLNCKKKGLLEKYS